MKVDGLELERTVVFTLVAEIFEGKFSGSGFEEKGLRLAIQGQSFRVGISGLGFQENFDS